MENERKPHCKMLALFTCRPNIFLQIRVQFFSYTIVDLCQITHQREKWAFLLIAINPLKIVLIKLVIF